MTRRRSKQPPSQRPPSFSVNLVSAVHWAGQALVVALVAGRILFPSEDCAHATGLDFTLLQLACGAFVLAETPNWRSQPRAVPTFSAWGILLALLWASAAHAEYRFPAIVLAWEWTAVAVVWWLIRRQSARTGPNPLAALIAAVVIGQSALALWQVTVSFPTMRARYELGGDAVRTELIGQGIAPGSPAEALFRDRLNASEPFGSFGHPNSLAGLLVLGLPILIVSGAEGRGGPGSRGRAVVHAAVILLVATALMLTESRSAWLAAIVSIGVLAALSRSGRDVVRKRRTMLIGSLVALAGLVGIMVATGQLDLLVLTESSKSLRYRFEWWQGSLGVIGESPWLGVGFGNFRAHYLGHKLPFSSEEISDPHNFALELWCCAGIFALLAYSFLLGSSLVGLVRDDAKADSGCDDADKSRGGLALGSWWWLGALAAPLLVGGLVSDPAANAAAGPGAPYPLVVIISWIEWPTLWSFAIGLAMVGWANHRTVVNWEASRSAIVAGVVGLHVHLLASGGIAFPGLLAPSWALLASGTPHRPTAEAGAKSSSARWTAWLLAAGTVATLIGLFLSTLYLPLARRDHLLDQSRKELRRDVAPAIARYRRAAEALPEDQSGWVLLAQAHAARMTAPRCPDRESEYRSAVRAWDRAIRLQPRRAENHRSLGRLHRTAGAMGLDADALERAVKAYEATVDRYPNSATRTWEFADVLRQAGRKNEAIEQYRRSLQLDRTPHPDKRLTESHRSRAKEFVER